MEEILILLGLWGLFVTFGVPVLAWQALQSANRANDAARQLSEKLDALDYRISNTSLSSAPQNSTPEAKTGTETLRAPIPTGSPASSRADDPVPDPIPTGPISVSASAPSPETAEAEPPAAAFDKQRQFNPDALLRGRGIVILGAITLGLGSILLVRHGIDAGWFSPIFRLMLGGLGGFGLIAGGEWLRRHPARFPTPFPPRMQPLPALLRVVSSPSWRPFTPPMRFTDICRHP